MNPYPVNWCGYTRSELATIYPSVHPNHVYHDMFRRRVPLQAMPGLVKVEQDQNTKKFLLEFADGARIETVLLPTVKNRGTVCLSSQAGCAMGCTFCLTGRQGLKRNLKAYEIVVQALIASAEGPVGNVVFMGMGEPLHNFTEVEKACHILHDDHGLNLSRRHITVSTSGLVPAILRLCENPFASLAVSLNAPTDEIRSQIMPINHKYPLGRLMPALREFAQASRRRILMEYVLLRGINDQDVHAKQLVDTLGELPCKVNLIPWNYIPGMNYLPPEPDRMRKFQNILFQSRVVATVRHTRGRDIMAACGQLSTDRARD